jgi:hypothetical protein
VTFVFGFALFALALVGAPYFAHRLRQRRAETRAFAATHLVPAAPPQARRRSELEDRSLFVVRALAVVGLALLGASPFVTCSRLSLARRGGASMALAIVLDDSLSMQAKLGGATRSSRARTGAKELLASTREGDAVAIVLAGAPARVALAPTTDLGMVRSILEAIPESDRATDLDGALSLARGLLDGLPQVDRRVVVLSDLADGNPEGPPLGEGSAIPVWNALPEIRADGTDCAVVRADRRGPRIRVRVACTPTLERPARTIAVTEGGRVLVTAPAPKGATGDVVLLLPAGSTSASEEPGALIAKLVEPDAVPGDDAAPVVAEAAPGSVAVVVPTDSETAATGGAPVVEQALTALQLDIAVRPLPQIPDRAEDLGAFVGVLLDDPPGLTPEERRALGAFVERGGVLLLALGTRASAPPLGASLEPFFTHPVNWNPTTRPGGAGADPTSVEGPLAESASSLRELRAGHRAELHPEDAALFTSMARWKDGAPLVARRALGRGEVWAVTLPFALDASDLPLRAAFLGLLDGWVSAARARTVARRTEVGVRWTFPDAHTLTIEGPAGHDNTSVDRAPGASGLETTPARIGVHRVHVDGRTELRVAEAVPREVDLRPRKLAVSAAGRGLGDNHASIDASPALAVALLALLALELALRVHAGRRARLGGAASPA